MPQRILLPYNDMTRYYKNTQESQMLSKFLDPKNDVAFKKIFGTEKRFSWNEEELLTYDQAEKYAWAFRASMDQKFDEGKIEGKLEVAKNMLIQGLDLEMVSKLTGLSTKAISSIQISDLQT